MTVRDRVFSAFKESFDLDDDTRTLVETPKTDKAKGGVMFSDMPAR